MVQKPEDGRDGHGPNVDNVAYIETMYERWLDDPDAVPEGWRELFDRERHGYVEPPKIGPQFRSRSIFNPVPPLAGTPGIHARGSIHCDKHVGVLRLIDHFRARGHYYAALCQMKSGIYEDACHRFEMAWKLDPRLARVPFHLGTCLHKLARYQEARFSLEQALEFFPEDGRIHYQLALTCDALGLPQEARLHYSQARAAREGANRTG